MIILNATDQQLEIKLGGVVTTNELPFVTSFADHIPATPAFTPAPQDGVTNGATPVVVMSPPSVSGIQRQLKFLSVFNADTVSQVVTVQYDNAATERVILAFTLLVGYTLEYNDGVGFVVKDTSGRTDGLDPNLFAQKALNETITGSWIHTARLEVSQPSGGELRLSNSGTVVVSGDIIGQVSFNAPNESSGGDALLVAGAVKAVAEADFSATENKTGLAFFTAISETATERMRLDQEGRLGINKLSSIGAQLEVLSAAAGRFAVIIDTAASPVATAVVIRHNGSQAIEMMQDGNRHIAFASTAFDNDAGVGTFIRLARNTDAVTPAPSSVVFEESDGGDVSVWSDDSGDLRIDAIVGVTSAQKGGGVVVGTQTSWHERKYRVRRWDGRGAVARIMGMPLYSFRFKECGQRGDKLMHGVVIKPRARRSWFSMNYADNQTPAMDEAEIIGNLLAMIQQHEHRIFEIEEAA